MRARLLRTAIAVTAAGCLGFVALAGCAPDPEPEPDPYPPGATVGVLLTEDLPGGDWSDPVWDASYAFSETHTSEAYPAFSCRMDNVNHALGTVLLEAHASASWTPRDRPAVVTTFAARYEDSYFKNSIPGRIEYAVDRCATAAEREDGMELTVTGTERAPVIEEVHRDDSQSLTWRVRTTWTTAPGDVIVVVSASWHDGTEPPVDVEALLPVAVERAATLPKTSPDPPWPPACEDC